MTIPSNPGRKALTIVSRLQVLVRLIFVRDNQIVVKTKQLSKVPGIYASRTLISFV